MAIKKYQQKNKHMTVTLSGLIGSILPAMIKISGKKGVKITSAGNDWKKANVYKKYIE